MPSILTVNSATTAESMITLEIQMSLQTTCRTRGYIRRCGNQAGETDMNFSQLCTRHYKIDTGSQTNTKSVLLLIRIIPISKLHLFTKKSTTKLAS